ncbi:ABC transporter ATP-binding protein [Halorarum halobium]|uniref:ABC transporter ATP-binding protein n=1 Tax=Halorarum halobium TaxID=3075121 RepID=UPI0028B0FCD1|nr:ABC transporter ATP-binding protein [Halobaculum sp. XH14]
MSRAGDGEPILSVEDLRVHFDSFDGTAEVIDGVDLTVNEGEVVAVVGETGCGKSVTMRSILGTLQQPPARIPTGEISFRGHDLLNASRTEVDRIKGRDIGMIFQDPMSSLNPVFTVGEQLTDTAQFGGNQNVGVLEYLRRKHLDGDRAGARKRVLELLEEVQMPDPERILDSYPSQLSGGMSQRVLIAQALLNEPDLLIADEIGTALDVTIHDQVLDLLRDLIEERNLSLLMITHNLGVARQLSDRVYIMYAGRIVETAPTEEIFRDPKHPYTQGLIASIPKLTGEAMADGIDGSIPEYIGPPGGCRFAARCPYAHDRCETERPELRPEPGGEHGVACFLYDEMKPAPYEKPTLQDTRDRMRESSPAPAATTVPESGPDGSTGDVE